MRINSNVAMETSISWMTLEQLREINGRTGGFANHQTRIRSIEEAMKIMEVAQRMLQNKVFKEINILRVQLIKKR
jgi:hypothetical protein